MTYISDREISEPSLLDETDKEAILNSLRELYQLLGKDWDLTEEFSLEKLLEIHRILSDELFAIEG